jgi:hypothetical protein
MTTRRRTATNVQNLATKSWELSLAAPQVVAQRVTRMMTAGPNPSARDQQEFMRMGNEKVVAFYESWMAMWGEAYSAYWQPVQHAHAAYAHSQQPVRRLRCRQCNQPPRQASSQRRNRCTERRHRPGARQSSQQRQALVARSQSIVPQSKELPAPVLQALAALFLIDSMRSMITSSG